MVVRDLEKRPCVCSFLFDFASLFALSLAISVQFFRYLRKGSKKVKRHAIRVAGKLDDGLYRKKVYLCKIVTKVG